MATAPRTVKRQWDRTKPIGTSQRVRNRGDKRTRLQAASILRFAAGPVRQEWSTSMAQESQVQQTPIDQTIQARLTRREAAAFLDIDLEQLDAMRRLRILVAEFESRPGLGFVFTFDPSSLKIIQSCLENARE